MCTCVFVIYLFVALVGRLQLVQVALVQPQDLRAHHRPILEPPHARIVPKHAEGGLGRCVGSLWGQFGTGFWTMFEKLGPVHFRIMFVPMLDQAWTMSIFENFLRQSNIYPPHNAITHTQGHRKVRMMFLRSTMRAVDGAPAMFFSQPFHTTFRGFR